MANKIKLTVGGIKYSISGDESQEYLDELGDELEQRLKFFTKRNPCLSTTMVAIMAALESCDDAKKVRRENEILKNRVKQLEKMLANQHK